MSMEQIRKKVMDLYSGDWPIRVSKMPDYQVMAIWERYLDKSRKEKHGTTRS